ncbi:MAG: sensor histidine kinase [Gaiellales bacterium]
MNARRRLLVVLAAVPAALLVKNGRLRAALQAQVQEVTASGRRLRDVLENVHLLAVSLDLDGRITYCNQHLADVAGWPREALVGSIWLERFPTGDPGFLDNLRRGEIRVHDEMPLLTRDGRTRDIWWSNTFDRDAEGNIVGATSIGEDVTDRNRSARQEAALRRLATMVAAEAPPEEIFHSLTEQVASLLDAHTANLVRFGDEPLTGVVVAQWSQPDVLSLEVGERVSFDGPTAVTSVIRTGQAARIDDYSRIEGSLAKRLRGLELCSSVAAPITVDGRPWGAITVSTIGDTSLPPDAERRVVHFAELVALALSSAEARAQLAASRARIVAAGDAERRRLERNLHDGAQQRLVTLALDLRMARASVEPGSEAAGRLEAASAELTEALAELRELARGIHPAVLVEQGLEPAIELLSSRCGLPVATSFHVDCVLNEQVEAAIYYVTSEALTNVAKYAQASAVEVVVSSDDGSVTLEVSDDGVGGADPAAGSGLSGLTDRVEALGGTLTVTSPAGGGTHVRASFPRSREPLRGAAPVR